MTKAPQAPADGAIHQACLYGSDDEFQAMALPFVNAGLAAGEPVLVATTAGSAALLKEGLGPSPTRR